MSYHPETIEVLSALMDGPLTRGELADRKATLTNLQTHKLVDGEKYKGVTTYTITLKGRRLMAQITKPMGGVALPRGPVVGTYTGEKPAAVRPGSMDAYSLPSLFSGERIERTRPLSISSKVQVRK
jgi:hypothetical protein